MTNGDSTGKSENNGCPKGGGLTHQRSKGNAIGIQWHRCGCCSIMNRRSRWQFNTILNSDPKSLRAFIGCASDSLLKSPAAAVAR